MSTAHRSTEAAHARPHACLEDISGCRRGRRVRRIGPERKSGSQMKGVGFWERSLGKVGTQSPP